METFACEDCNGAEFNVLKDPVEEVVELVCLRCRKRFRVVRPGRCGVDVQPVQRFHHVRGPANNVYGYG